jgi:hypothetical protein
MKNVNKIDFSTYPTTVTLHFISEDERDEFIGQLSDGWGENEVDLDWNWHSDNENEPSVDDEPFDHYLVRVMDEELR